MGRANPGVPAPERPLTRRQRELAALYGGAGLPRPAGAAPRVAVVGAGLAGLNAATLLQQAGCTVDVYEAADRLGGRIRTERGQRGDGPVWELGGEFVDSRHDDIHALAAALGVPILDTVPRAEAALRFAYRFGGQDYDDAEACAALVAVAPRIEADIAQLGGRPGWRRASPAARRLDRCSLADYLAGLDAEPWLRRLLEVAFVTVYGLDAGEQSALNLLTLIGTDTRRGLQLFGSSDERFKLRDGSDALIAALAARLPAGHVHRRHELVRLRRDAAGWILDFRGDGPTRAVRADAVVLALPFTLLRRVELQVPIPLPQRRAIDDLGYGTNAKLMLGMHGRPWRALGFEGGSYSDLPLQTTWDCSRRRGGDIGVLTVYLGGRAGAAIGDGDLASQAARHLALADTLFPGVQAAWTGDARVADWPREPWARGSYTCYRPGQWTAFGGAEGLALPGGLYFAGEHCAKASQGYMNGAAQTGRLAALALLRHCA